MSERRQVKTVDWCLIRIHDQEAIIETQRDRIAELEMLLARLGYLGPVRA